MSDVQDGDSGEHTASQGGRRTAVETFRRRFGLERSPSALERALANGTTDHGIRTAAGIPLLESEQRLVASTYAAYEAWLEAPKPSLPPKIWAGEYFKWDAAPGAWVLRVTENAEEWGERVRDEGSFPFPGQLQVCLAEFSLAHLQATESSFNEAWKAESSLGRSTVLSVRIDVERNRVVVEVDSSASPPPWLTEYGAEVEVTPTARGRRR